MTDRRSTRTLMLTTSAVLVAAVAIAAQAQTVTSPFAKKKKKQAWETQQPAAPAPAATQPQQNIPQAPTTYTVPAQPSEVQNLPQPAQSYAQPSQNPPAYSTYQYDAPLRAPVVDESYQVETLPGYRPRAASPDGAYYPGRSQPPQSYAGPMQSSPQSQPPMSAPQKQGWADRMGLNNVMTTLSGFLKLGAAGTRRGGKWGEEFIVDGAARGELSMVTQGGLEYGAGLALRGQYDETRRGFGGRVGDCPPTLAGCANVLVGGTATAIRGHTSQFYTNGPSNAKDVEFQMEGAYLFLRSAYGDITAGRDDGAAYLFSLGAPTLLAVGPSNNSVDYSGLDAVKTVNDASGFARKITYTTPRLLGDTIGVGVQLGASYSPDARVCGTDYCVRTNGKDGTGVLSPVLEDVMEAGLSLDRNFGNGLKVEATATYAQASEKSNLVAFDDLKAWGAGLEISYDTITLGGSYLDSNNGLANGDYTAWDVGATWQPSALGFTLGYGHATDKNVGLTSDQGVFGVSYDWNERYRIGTGVQYIEREVPFNIGGIATPTKEKATALFVEGRITF